MLNSALASAVNAIDSSLHDLINAIVAFAEIGRNTRYMPSKSESNFLISGAVHYASCRTLEQQGREDDEGKG
jgi:hypothetical protein